MKQLVLVDFNFLARIIYDVFNLSGATSMILETRWLAQVALTPLYQFSVTRWRG